MEINFEKGDGLVPVIIQEAVNKQVLMLGYMNQEAYLKTKKEGIVTFFSRSKDCLWTKGETSGDFLNVESMSIDCDQDTILIQVRPEGNTCHKGTYSCFGEKNASGFIYELEDTITKRADSNDESSYTRSLLNRGINKVAQKVGEEAVELVIETKDDNDDLFLNEAADLMYHYLVLLRAKGKSLRDVEGVLIDRNN